MGISFSKVRERVFQILKGHGYSLTIFDEDGNKTFAPEEGQYFYAQPDQIMVSIHDEGEYSSIKMYTSKNTTEENLQSLSNQLRQTATRFNLSWTIRQFGKEITPKDFAYMISQRKATTNENDTFSFLRSLLETQRKRNDK